MKTTVDNNQITISYGVGWIKKQIRLDSLMSAKVVKGRWYHGAGIKHLDGGMLYSINFTGSVELRTKYSDKFIRIGSSDTERLTSEI